MIKTIMLVFAAHVPHTPLILPTVGRENTEKLKKTNKALKNLAEELYAAQPDILFILAAHGNPTKEAFSINLNDHYQTDLSEFGDLTTKFKYAPELHCVDSLQRFLRKSQIPFSLFSEPHLGHAVSVPLITLTEKIKKIAVVPFFIAPDLSPKIHFELGQALKEVISCSDQRVAVISAGDLSHALSSQAPAGLRPEGKKFDSLVRGAIKNLVPSNLLQLDEKFLNQAAECAFLPIITLLGLLEGTGVRAEELSYEAPFGVGYLTIRFVF